MRRVVAQNLHRLCRLASDDRHARIALDAGGEVLHLVIHLDGERRLGEAGTDRRRDLGARHRPGKATHFAVRQRDGDGERAGRVHGRGFS